MLKTVYHSNASLVQITDGHPDTMTIESVATRNGCDDCGGGGGGLSPAAALAAAALIDANETIPSDGEFRWFSTD